MNNRSLQMCVCFVCVSGGSGFRFFGGVTTSRPHASRVTAKRGTKNGVLINQTLSMVTQIAQKQIPLSHSHSLSLFFAFLLYHSCALSLTKKREKEEIKTTNNNNGTACVCNYTVAKMKHTHLNTLAILVVVAAAAGQSFIFDKTENVTKLNM